MVFILKIALCLASMAVLPCAGQEVHSDRRLDAATICPGGGEPCFESTAHKMFDIIAQFATEDPSATFPSTTSATFDGLFTCTASDPNDDLPVAQHSAWQGFTDYAKAGANTIFLTDENGNTVEVDDTWGERCENEPLCGVGTFRYQECKESLTCVPKPFEYPLPDSTVLYIDIYEPCNFVSNLAYYRVPPQLCGGHFYMDDDTSKAFIHSFMALGAGSAMWHGSHTFLGSQADNQLIAVIAFLVHQQIVGGLALANPSIDVTSLMDIQAQPRAKTAVQTASDVTDILTSKNISEWPQELVDLDVPEYETTFAVIVASILTILFPDRDLSLLLDGLGSLLGGNTGELNAYLPVLQELSANLNLSDGQKFALFWQLLGMACKMVFAFLWQEQVLQIDLFLQPETNALAPTIMPVLVSTFNFMAGFEHVDESFQKFDGMYPGDEACRETVPHAKWHELSASALLDMVYLTDCVAAVVTGSDAFGCAHLSSLAGSADITRDEISTWIDTTVVVPNMPIIEDLVHLFIEEMVLLFDLDNNDKIEWNDIEDLIDTVEDIVQPIIDVIEDIIDRIENVCTSDSDCDAVDEFCNPLQLTCRPKRENDFFPCIKDSQCYSDRCVDRVVSTQRAE